MTKSVPEAANSFRSASDVGLFLALLALLALCPVLLPKAFVVELTSILIFAVAAVSLNLLVGYTGMISLGHAAYFAIGAYTAGILVKHAGFGMAAALLLAPVLAGIAGAIVGYFCIRLTEAYFIMLTLAFGQLVYVIVWKWREWTGGDDGLVGIEPAEALAGTYAYYYFTLVISLVCLVLLHRFCHSTFGRALKAIRDNPARAEASGIDVKLFQLAAFTLASAMAGIAGGIYAFHSGGVFPDTAHWLTSANLLLMVVIGGAGYFGGPVLGAFVFLTLQFLVGRVTSYWFLVLGVLILIVAVTLPHGLMALFRRLGSTGVPR